MDEERDIIELIIPEPVKDVLQERMILEEDIRKVIEYTETTANKFKNTDKDSYIAYFKPVSVTY